MYSWMLYTPDALVLDLTDTNITSMQDIEQAFHALDLCPKGEGRDQRKVFSWWRRIQKRQQV